MIFKEEIHFKVDTNTILGTPDSGCISNKLGNNWWIAYQRSFMTMKKAWKTKHWPYFGSLVRGCLMGVERYEFQTVVLGIWRAKSSGKYHCKTNFDLVEETIYKKISSFLYRISKPHPIFRLTPVPRRNTSSKKMFGFCCKPVWSAFLQSETSSNLFIDLKTLHLKKFLFISLRLLLTLALSKWIKKISMTLQPKILYTFYINIFIYYLYMVPSQLGLQNTLIVSLPRSKIPLRVSWNGR